MTILSAMRCQSALNTPATLGAFVLSKSKWLVARAAGLTATATAVSAICLMAGQTALADDAKVKSFSLNTQAVYQFDQVNITSSSGERWDTIEPGTIKFQMSGRLDTKWPGEVVESAVFLGDCANQQCANYPILGPSWNHARTRDLNFDRAVSFSTSRIPVGSPNAVMLSDFGQKALAACNAGENNGPRKTKSFYRPMTISYSVNTQKNARTSRFAGAGDEDFGGGDTTQRSTFSVKVNCIPYASMVEGAEPVEVSLSIIKPNSNVCPATGTAMTRMVFHYPKTATFDIKRNGKVIKTVEIKARKVALSHGPDQWVIDRHDQVEVEGGQNEFRVKVRGGGKSKLVRFNLNCPEFDVLFSSLRYDVVNTNSCPKKVYETVSFITNGPGEATYQLVQESGHVFYEKKLESIFKNGQYKLVGQRVLDIPQAFEGKFKAQIKGKSGINTGWKTLKVECPAKVSGVGAGAVGGLTVGPKPNQAAEKTTKTLVAPKPSSRDAEEKAAARKAAEKAAARKAAKQAATRKAAEKAAARKAAKKAAARKAAKQAAARKAAEKAAARKAAKQAAARKAAEKAAARKAAKQAAARKAAEKAAARKAAKQAAARKAAKKAAARKAAKKAAARKAAKQAAARKAAKKAAARKAAKKAAARKAAKKAAARKAAKRANANNGKAAQRANSRKCGKGKTLVRGRCIKPAG